MAISRLGLVTPPSNANWLLHTSSRNAVVSVIATNRGITNSTVRIWTQPNGATDPSQYAYIAYDVDIPAMNTLETFKFAINNLDTVYVRSTSASVNFMLNGIYETNGTSNVTVSTTEPQNPSIGDIWVDPVTYNILYWTGTQWLSGTADTSTYPFPVYQSASPTNPLVGQIWIDSDADTYEITEDRLVPVSSGSTVNKYLVSDGAYGQWQTLATELPVYTSSSSMFLKVGPYGNSLLWTADVAPINSPNFIGPVSASTVPYYDSSTRVATTEWVTGKGYLTSSAALAFAAPKYDPVFYNSLTVPVQLQNGYLYALSSGSVISNIPTVTVGTSKIAVNSASTSLAGIVGVTYTDVMTQTGKNILYTGYWNGVETNTYYWRSGGDTFRWYLNVTPDYGTTDKMELNTTGLVVNGTVTPTSLTPIAGTTSVAPVRLTSGTNLSSPQSGAMEWDGKALYFTPDSSAVGGRSVVNSSILVTSTSDLTLSDVNTAQNLFTAANDTLTNVAGATSYLMECLFHVKTAGSVSNALQFGLGGTATYTSVAYEAVVSENATSTATIATNSYESYVIANTATTISTAVATATYRTVRIKGVVRINAAGTLIPQITFTAAPGAAPVVLANAYFSLTPFGSNTAVSIGAWA